MNLDDEYVAKLKEIDSYQVAVHKIMSSLKIADYEADQLLYMQLVDHRLSKHPKALITKQIDEGNSNLKWLITYAGRDVKRRELKEMRRQQRIKEQLSKYNLDTIKLNNADKLSEDDRDKIIGLLPKLFRNHNTAEWCAFLLEYGELETKSHYGMNNRQFLDKIYSVEKLCKQHREKTINIVLSKEQQGYVIEEDTLKEFTQCLEAENYTDQKFQQLIKENYGYIDNLSGQIPDLKRPLLLLAQFDKALLHDKYKLVNKIYERIAELESRFIE